MNTLKKLTRSSQDPKKLSMTIKGILTSLVLVLSITGVVPTDAIQEVGPLADSLVLAVEALLAAFGAVWTVWGAIRRIRNTYFLKKG